ncbi:hypothetical protein [Aminobacter sp. DSM 101952]|uniref:hypothetical protein n=1 Tax=Aminobacter sp. DSM 101952 TaxID=2735891 RepID=UPI0012E343DF|nr:hypothetical protein [Aminobacter sp. DSM 101952]
MQILKTDITKRFETGSAYFYKVSFMGEAGQSIVVDYASDELIESDDLVEEQALRVMAETAGISVESAPLELGPEAAVGPSIDDDDPYQESDQALPEDIEERAISQSPTREGGRFHE